MLSPDDSGLICDIKLQRGSWSYSISQTYSDSQRGARKNFRFGEIMNNPHVFLGACDFRKGSVLWRFRNPWCLLLARFALECLPILKKKVRRKEYAPTKYFFHSSERVLKQQAIEKMMFCLVLKLKNKNKDRLLSCSLVRQIIHQLKEQRFKW